MRQSEKIAEEMEKTQSKLDAKQAEITEAEENLVQAKVEENTQYQSMKDPHQIYVREWKYGIY